VLALTLILSFNLVLTRNLIAYDFIHLNCSTTLVVLLSKYSAVFKYYTCISEVARKYLTGNLGWLKCFLVFK